MRRRLSLVSILTALGMLSVSPALALGLPVGG